MFSPQKKSHIPILYNISHDMITTSVDAVDMDDFDRTDALRH